MPRVPVHTVDDAPAESREALKAQGERVGKVNVIRTIMTNYVNHLVGTEVDLPEAPPLG